MSQFNLSEKARDILFKLVTANEKLKTIKESDYDYIVANREVALLRQSLIDEMGEDNFNKFIEAGKAMFASV